MTRAYSAPCFRTVSSRPQNGFVSKKEVAGLQQLVCLFPATSMSNGASNAHSIILTEAISKARSSSFVNNMDARSDCELPHHLAELGVVLWMSKDLQGWKALIKGIK